MNKLLIIPMFFLTMCGTAPVTPPAGACSSCAMSAQTLKMGIENKLLQDFPDCNGVIQVL